MVRLNSRIVFPWLTTNRLHALFRITVAHAPALLRNATQQHQMTLMVTLKFLVTHPVLEIHPSITEHILDVAVFLSDYTSDDVRNQLARLESIGSKEDPFCSCIFGTTTPVDGWLVLTKPVSHIQTPSPSPNQSLTPQYQGQTAQTPGPGAAANQQRYLNQQRQQQQMQAHQAQQMRNYPPYPAQTTQQTKMLPAQLSRASSNMSAHSPLQQMQHMQHMQGLAQQRATQPSPVSSQRPVPATGMAGAMAAKLQARQEREVRQYPFVQPRWEILAESSGNPNANETAINLSLFGARRA
jgi:mediator of RNA polymerase II transcription subunit 12